MVSFLLLWSKDTMEMNNNHALSLIFCIIFDINHHFLLRRGHPTWVRKRARVRQKWKNDEIYTSRTLFKWIHDHWTHKITYIIFLDVVCYGGDKSVTEGTTEGWGRDREGREGKGRWRDGKFTWFIHLELPFSQ